ncbi:helix-turn-helix domain-containing protein [Bacteroides propionicifaciens]|jgi:AraC-like DNA-binding protein/mannose-6-phosphate isomerase-like protein (cupin superfamily)|uniref:helix-turn-helix domain-containing protein n=3 Tax=Bacteroides propionicifaciens TaxID=392838 RepID=UPI00035CD064|nr:AraC family transcriptional regulator [Bacteroides propionicifaciens]
MKHQIEEFKDRSSVDDLVADAYVWFEDNWHHEKLPHTHKYYQLTYVEEGYQYFHIADKIYFVPQNHVILIPCDTLHRTTSDSKAVILKVILFKTLPDKIFYQQTRVFSAPSVLKEMLLYAGKWNKLTDQDEEQSAFLYAMLLSLPYFYQENNFLEIPIPRDARLNAVCGYINQNYRYNISTDQLADVATMSERNLQRIFKQETGITLKKYMQLIRILKSIELLDTKQYTLTEVAYRVGYKSLSAFTNSYATIMKTKPKKKV